ncbi:MAG: hypothetical protein MUF64_20405 [Polyangiaceae bacterium]|jgi:hypothetical protein|nr:hypothetical protein [Polyangiaceae bacterium]
MKVTTSLLLALGLVACGASSETNLSEATNTEGPEPSSSNAPVCLGEPGAQVVLDEQAREPLVVSGGEVFFFKEGYLTKRPTKGGPAVKISDKAGVLVGRSEQSLFLQVDDESSEFRIIQVPKAGGPAQELVNIDYFPGEIIKPSVAVMPDGTVYFASNNNGKKDGLWRKYRGNSLELIRETVFDTYPFFLDRGPYTTFSASEGLQILARIEDNGALTEVLSGVTTITPWNFMTAGTEIFFLMDGAIFRTDVADKEPQKDAIYSVKTPDDFQSVHLTFSDNISGEHLPFVETTITYDKEGKTIQGSWKIARVPRRGGPAETIIAGENDAPYALAEDPCHLYWIDNQRLIRMRKP